MKRSWMIAVGMLAASALTLAVRTSPIAAAPKHARVRPDFKAIPTSKLSLCWAEYARNSAWGQVATAGVSHASTWDITVSGVVVRHPRGDFVIDVGNSSHFKEEIQEYGALDHFFLAQLPGSNITVRTAPDALRAVGLDPDALFGVLLSHAHVDHAGGLVDLPKAPVFLAPPERAFFASTLVKRSPDVVPAHARAIEGRTHELEFANGPYETFDESADLFGDGSVVVVKLYGHTPGSIGTFVNLSPSVRLFHVGDSVNVVEAVERRLPKSIVMSTTDNDGPEAAVAVARIAQLHEAAPEIAILPAHDRPAWQRIFGAEPGCLER
jgi:glyoxylase-like metal-dependent hydrolase (beta-lactamase superfamily II)